MFCGESFSLRWLLAGFGGVAALFASSAMAHPKECITDAELEAAVGDQVRSGVFAINTSKLREAQMCSGIPVARAIQRMAQSASATSQPTAQQKPHPQEAAQAEVKPTPTIEVLPDISRSLSFESPRTCPSDGFAAVFRNATDGKPAFLAPLGRIAFRKTGPDREGWINAKAGVEARWNGLTITGFEFSELEDFETSTAIISFQESASTVLPVLRRLGFSMTRINSDFTQPGDIPVAIAIRDQGAGSELRCET